MFSQLRRPHSLAIIPALAALVAVSIAAAPPARAGSSAAALQARISSALRGIGASYVDYRIEDSAVGTLTQHADTPTAPASNEKLLTTVAVLQSIAPTFRYTTPVSGTAPIVGNTLDGDLVLVGSGDPTLTLAGLRRMAAQLRALGLRTVTGHLIVDDTRYSHRTRLRGWKHNFVPVETGTVDAFSVNANEWRSGAAFEADPTPYNAAMWRKDLQAAHITVAKRTIIEAAPKVTVPLLTHRSKPLSAIIADMLTNSVNFEAEMLLREVGAVRTGYGSPASGIAAIKAAARALHLPLGAIYDGSGLSYADRETPATLTAWLDAIKAAPYFSTVYDGLALSCKTGTLRDRLCGRHVKGRIRAKTGTLNHVATLSGYLNTDSGHQVTFSIFVSGFPDSKYNRIYQHVDAALAQVSIHG